MCYKYPGKESLHLVDQKDGVLNFKSVVSEKMEKMQRDGLTIGSNLGFGVLPKDSSKCGQEEVH